MNFFYKSSVFWSFFSEIMLESFRWGLYTSAAYTRVFTVITCHIICMACVEQELRGQPFYFFWGGREVVGDFEKDILQVHMHKKKIPAQDH